MESNRTQQLIFANAINSLTALFVCQTYKAEYCTGIRLIRRLTGSTDWAVNTQTHLRLLFGMEVNSYCVHKNRVHFISDMYPKHFHNCIRFLSRSATEYVLQFWQRNCEVSIPSDLLSVLWQYVAGMQFAHEPIDLNNY